MKWVSLAMIGLIVRVGALWSNPVSTEQGFYVSAAGNDANDGLTESLCI